jgi:uncharacterized protein YraI
MKRIWFEALGLLAAGVLVGGAMFGMPGQVRAEGEAQTAGPVATVTYSEPINVRGGPSTVYYPIVGRVSPGDVLPALGVSPGREWVQVAFPSAPGGVGWVYAAYVTISGGELRVVEPPPTQTPIATPTINPTFAAAFIFQPTPSRVPTFTPPPPLEVPQFTETVSVRTAGLAPGAVVFGLLVVAAMIFFISLVLSKQ